ncbi:MAG: hypothetical protein QNI86_07170, partial [Halieaceae bacterium]|nr:hypothetical protein [Halieaceae bacterium]
ARNFIRSRLDDAMDRAERASDSDGSGTDSDLEECRRLQVELEQEVDPGGVPAEFRHLIPWILRLGVGDDPCRALVTEALDQGEREQAVEAFSAHAAAINAWLDSFGDESFPPEAAAFLYSLLALEELQAHG